jgi:TP901 family phage tail tape measure protein
VADRTVKVRLEAIDANFTSTMRKASNETKTFAKNGSEAVGKNKADWDKLGNAALVGGAAIGVAVLGAAKAYAGFEKAMSNVAAVSGATAGELDALSEAAINAGRDTSFSASQAADAEAELVKAGVAVKDVLDGGLIGSMNLAAAGQIDLAQAAEIAAQSMNLFGLEGKDVGHIADVLTAGANKSAAGVGDLGQALSQSGLVAAQLGINLDDTVGVLSAFADRSLKGSDAGTAFKTMLQRLTPQSTEAQGAMDELGIKAFDLQGNFVGLADFAGQLQTAMSGLTMEQRNAAMTTIFGSDAVRASNVLYELGAEGVREYTKAVDDQGAAARMAARQMDNLAGDVEVLKGSLETAFIEAGRGGNEGLRSLTQTLTTLVNKFSELPPAVQSDIVIFAALSAGTLLVGGAAIKATTGILAMKASMDAASFSAGRLSTALKFLGGTAAVGGVALLAIELGRLGPAADVAEVSIDRLVESAAQLTNGGRLTGGIADLFREDNGVFGSDEKWVSTAEAIDRFAIRAKNAFGEDFSSQARRIQDFGASGQKMTETVSQIDGALAEMVQNGNGDKAREILEALLSGIDDPGVVAKTRAEFTKTATALDAVATAGPGAASGVKEVSDNLTISKKAAEDAKEAVDDYIQSLQDAGLVVLDRRAAERGFQEALDAVSERITKRTELEKELKEAQNRKVDTDTERERKADDIARLKEELKSYADTLDISTQAGRDQQEVLDGVAGSALDLAQAIYDQTGSEDAYRASLVKSRPQLIKSAEALGMNKKEAKAFADAVLQIPPKKAVTVTTNIPAQLAAAKAFQSYINGLQGKDIRIGVRYNAGGNDQTGGVTAASGGYISGPGTGTSDSIPAWLSNGEYVIKAAAVSKYGVGFLEKVNRMRFADGGFVGGQTMPARVMAGGPTAQTVTNDSSLRADVVNIVTPSPSAFKREIRTAPYRAKARPGR